MVTTPDYRRNIRKDAFDIYIFGHGGLAAEIYEIAQSLDLQPLTIVKNLSSIGSSKCPYILEDELEKILDLQIADCVIGIGNSRVREELTKKFRNRVNFISLFHSSLQIARSSLELINGIEGTLILAGTHVSSRTKIGNYCVLNQGVNLAHDVEMEDYVTIGPGAIICGNVKISKHANIGAGAIIKQGRSESDKLTIAEGVIIGAGAVVIDSLETGTYVGSPARRIY